MRTVADIIDLWPSQADFAADCGAKWMTAHQWRRRDKIPPEYWAALVRSAKRRALPVTEKLLADMAARKRSNQLTGKRRRPLKNKASQRHQAVSA
jgi:hypothetical protein